MSLAVLFKHSDLDEDKGQSVVRNMKTNFLKQKAEQASQLEFLDRQISLLDHTRKKSELRIIKGIKELKQQAEYLEKEQARVNTMKEKLEREKSDPNFTLNLGNGRPVSRQTPLYTPSRRRRPILKPLKSDDVQFTRYCRFNHKEGECKMFPCAPCTSYHHMGLFWDDDRTDVRSVTRGLSARSKSKLWQEVEASSVLKPLRVPYNKSIKLENALQKNIKHMREKNKKAKPKDWSVRYGEGTSLRKMRSVVRI